MEVLCGGGRGVLVRVVKQRFEAVGFADLGCVGSGSQVEEGVNIEVGGQRVGGHDVAEER